MGEGSSGMKRSASVLGLGVVLVVIAVLALLNLALHVVGYFQSAAYGGVATRLSLLDSLLEVPQQTLVPAAIVILAGIAGVGVFRGRRWGQILAVGVGAATLLGGLILLWIARLEWGVPGSFAVLIVPPGCLALIVGAFVLYAALANRRQFDA